MFPLVWTCLGGKSFNVKVSRVPMLPRVHLVTGINHLKDMELDLVVVQGVSRCEVCTKVNT